MKKILVLLTICLVSVVCVYGQTQTAKNRKPKSAPPSQKEIRAANRAWPAFWRAFLAAMNSRDHATLHKMMPDDFFDGGGGLDSAEWLVFIEENRKNGSWRDLQKSFRQGTVVHAEWTREGVPTRVTKNKAYYFEFRKDQRWYFAGIVSH
jgi:hypothetical protein